MTTTAGRAPSDKGKNSPPREVATSPPREVHSSPPREVHRSHPREVYSSRGCEIFRPPHTSHSPLAPGEILRFRYAPLRMTDATSTPDLRPLPFPSSLPGVTPLFPVILSEARRAQSKDLPTSTYNVREMFRLRCAPLNMTAPSPFLNLHPLPLAFNTSPLQIVILL